MVERKNRTLKEMMNAMLISSGLPQNMWGEVVLTTNYLLNKVPKKKAKKTSYELWKGRNPFYKYLRVWGCLVKVVVPPPKKVKIGPKTVDCIFIRYAHNSSAYRFLVHESNITDIHKNTIMESMDELFFEDVFPCNSKEETGSSKLMLETVDENSQDQNKYSEVELIRSKRARVEKYFGLDYLTYMLEGEPQTYKEAINSTNVLTWKEAIKNEIDSILHNHTWKLVDLPPCCKPLSSKWVFKRKRKVNGSIDKCKAKLVIKGYKETKGLDYYDTYSPMTRINSIRMVLTIAALRNLELHQMDVKTTFLNGDLDEEIYMKQPEGFSATGEEKEVCKLVKSLYSLKQWHEKFDNVMMLHGFKINECDKCVYIKDTKHGYVMVCLYVDNMFIVGSDDKMIISTKNMLNSRFDMKYMGPIDVILEKKS